MFKFGLFIYLFIEDIKRAWLLLNGGSPLCVFFFKMIAIMTRLEGQEKPIFTQGWLCNTNYFLTPPSHPMARATDP